MTWKWMEAYISLNRMQWQDSVCREIYLQSTTISVPVAVHTVQYTCATYAIVAGVDF